MAEPFIGTVEPFAFNYAPFGWALCQGQLMQIQQNTALYALIGTTYGGDGKTTFGIPDLRSRIVVGMGQAAGLSNYPIGSKGGVETVTLDMTTMPSHNHPVPIVAHSVDVPADAQTPGGDVWATDGNNPFYALTSATPTAAMDPKTLVVTIQPSGTATPTPHSNIMPVQAINFCIALQGDFPTRA